MLAQRLRGKSSLPHRLHDGFLSPPSRLPQLAAAIELVGEISRQLSDRKSEAVAEISGTFEELERALHQRKAALVTDLENICTAKQKAGSASRLWPRRRLTSDLFSSPPPPPALRCCRLSCRRCSRGRSTSKAAAASRSRR